MSSSASQRSGEEHKHGNCYSEAPGALFPSL